ncbi:hypothetical protein MRX96_033414 [Rhipicephalus microplus]
MGLRRSGLLRTNGLLRTHLLPERVQVPMREPGQAKSRPCLCEGQVAAGSRSSAPTLTSGTRLPMAHDPCAEVKAAEDASGESVYISAVVAREKLDGRKAHARNFHASPVSGSHTDAPGPSDAHA